MSRVSNQRRSASSRSTITIRSGKPTDAARIAALANRLNVLMGEPDGRFSAALVRRDLLGKRPATSVLVAESDRRVVGYALFHDSYNTDIPARSVWIVDLMVDEDYQRRGVGKRLMAEVARLTVARGARALALGVLARNRPARRFYEAMGGDDPKARIIEFEGAALRRLAREANEKHSRKTGSQRG